MAGWPWPLDGVQSWFDSLWNWVSTSAFNAGRWVWTQVTTGLASVKDYVLGQVSWVANYLWGKITWLKDQVSSGLSYVGSQVWGFITWLSGQVSSGLSWLWNAISGAVSGISSWITNGLSWVWNQISSGLSSLSSFITSSVGWLGGQISSGLNNLWTAISSTVGNFAAQVSNGLKWVWDSLSGLAGDLLGGVVEALGSGLQAFWDWLLKHLTWISQMIIGAINPVISAVQGFLMDVGRRILDGLTATFTPGSPDEELETAISVMVETMQTRVAEEVQTMYKSPPEEGAVLATARNVAVLYGVGVVGGHILGQAADAAHPLKHLGFADLADTITSSIGIGGVLSRIFNMPTEVGLLIPLRHAYNKMFTPEIPGSGDLVRMVVREAFDPKMVIEAPPEFIAAMAFQGFSKTWCDRYWTAHFEPIPLLQAYANLWRGDWTKEEFMYALHIADVHPMWREPIFNVAFRPPGARELGYGYDTNLYDRDDIVKYRRWGGLSLEDAEKAADAMIAYRLEAERNALRTEAMADYVAGLDDEAQLRANLTAIGGRPEMVELWVERARYRRDRDLVLDLMKTSVDLYVKGHINDQGLDQDLRALGIEADRRAVVIRDAKARRSKAVVAQTAEKKKLLSVEKVEKARELGLLGDGEFVTRAVEIGYTEGDARLLLAIELTPKPVTAEEISRRQRTITSKKARAERRYETSLARLQDQIDLSAAQISDAETVAKETLDVIDAQIEAHDLELPTATPARAATIEKLRTVQLQRRELQEARSAATIRKLTEQRTDLEEAKALIDQQRDEELAEYDEELKLLGVAS